MKILFVGGTFDLTGGKESGLSKKMYNLLRLKNNDIKYYNGGNYNELEGILNSVVNYDTVFWMAYVPNELPKIRDVKKINPYAIVIGSKRNDDNKYSFVEILNRSLMQRNNLTIEFSKVNNRFNMLLFDPLGSCYYDGCNLEILVKIMYKRILFLKTVTRKHTYQINKNVEIPNNEEFYKYVRRVAKIFHETIEHAPGVTKFLGNASYRGKNNNIYVSKRDVDKSKIDKDNFVLAFRKKGRVYFYGNNKPSKDTVVQTKLYDMFKNINYIVHSHCYAQGGLFTSKSVPCGALEEVDEIVKVIKDNLNSNYELTYYKFNLIGHGCLILASSILELEKTEYITRHLPEYF